MTGVLQDRNDFFSVELSNQSPINSAASLGGFGHVAQLDGIRAIAVIIVVAAHAGLQDTVPGGFGVTVFFFLSGYLITSLLRNEFEARGQIDLKAFYVRRFLRIHPPLLITMLVAGLLVGFRIITASVDPMVALAQALFFVNYMRLPGATDGLPVTGLWSLAVEEHFYLAFPLLYRLYLSKVPHAFACRLLLCLCFVVLLGRCANALIFLHGDWNYCLTHTRIDSIMFGCCLAIYRNPMLDRDACGRIYLPALAAAVIIIAFSLVVRDELFRQTLRYTFQGIALMVLFSAALQIEGFIREFLSCAVLRWIGTFSYTIYIAHEMMFVLVEQHFGTLPPFCRIAAALTLTFFYAGLMYWLVERPLAIMRRNTWH